MPKKSPIALRRALRSILLILCFDAGARLLPLRIGPVAQFVEIAARSKVSAAVHHDGLAVEPGAAVAHQKGREILQFFHAAGSSHRIHLGAARSGLIAGAQTLAHAFGGDLARSNGVEADPK